jgi:antitoxin FitA
MGQIIVRNLEDGLIQRLKRRAAEQKLSLEETVRRILAQAEPERFSKNELLAEMARIQAMGKPISGPPYAEDLIREDRDGGEDGRYRR